MRDAGPTALAILFGVLLVGGLLLLGYVAVRVLVGGVDRAAHDDLPLGDEPPDAAPPGAVPHGPSSRSAARRILDERYARGELGTAEYREHVETLGEGS